MNWRSILAAGFVCYSSASQIPRDDTGRIKRSRASVREFKQVTGHPEGRPGYVIDHIIPLKKGGCDDPRNMQWQTIQDAKEKDRWE